MDRFDISFLPGLIPQFLKIPLLKFKGWVCLVDLVNLANEERRDVQNHQTPSCKSAAKIVKGDAGKTHERTHGWEGEPMVSIVILEASQKNGSKLVF